MTRRLPGLALALLLPAPAAHAQAGRFREAEVKAVFLLSIARFVEWPAEAFDGPAAPVVIGVLGDDPFGEALDEAVRGESVRGRPVSVRRFDRLGDLEPCQVLYISPSERARLRPALARLGGSPVLTVGETARFARLGGMIRLKTVGGRVRFEINKEAADRAGLRLDSRLLRLAEEGE